MLFRSDSTMYVLATLYDQKHLPKTYFETLSFILSPSIVTINAQALCQTMTILTAQKEEHKLSIKMKNIQMVSLRPRLRDRLKTSLFTEKNKESIDNKLGTWDSYTGFCHIHRFPNNLSDKVKRQLYFMASQTTWNWGDFVKYFIQHQELQERVKQHQIGRAHV